MTKKELFKSEILMKMKRHLDASMISILDVVLSDALYKVNIVDMETHPATQDMTNEYILQLYELKKGGKLSEETIRAYMIGLREFLRYVNKSLLQVTQEDVEQYLREKKRRGNNNKSLNNKRRKLNTFFDWMRKNELIQKNPVENIEPFTEALAPIDHLDPEEMEKLKTACRSKRDRALLEWLRCTAMRKGEISSVNINQINWAERKVIIYGQKGHAYRTVCLDSVAVHYLLEYIEERGLDIRSSQPLFTHSKGDTAQPLSKDGIYAEIRRIGQRSGLNRRIYPHLFRKTVATNVIRRGGTDADAGEYLGHKPQGVTARHYAYRSEDHVIKIFQNYVAAI